MMIRRYILCILLAASILSMASCRKDDPIVSSTSTYVGGMNSGDILGFYLLNEGNMGSNKATLDYYDYKTGYYTKNIYSERNPNVVNELGDVGNDIQIYRGRIYAVINCSNLIEVMDASSAKHIGQVSIPNCRYIVFDGDYAYVSSYAGPVQVDPNARLGYVAKIDINTLEIVSTCVVGYQPEEMVISGGKLYVANSGGYRVPNYDNTVSVIDLKTFSQQKKIEVAINLHRMSLDGNGHIWVSSRGDYYSVKSNLYIINPETDAVEDCLDVACSDMSYANGIMYICSNAWSYEDQDSSIDYCMIDTKNREVISGGFIKDGTDKKIKVPYGLAVNPITEEIFVTDAGDYVTPGTVYCFGSNGALKWSVTAGDIPAHIAFYSDSSRND